MNRWVFSFIFCVITVIIVLSISNTVLAQEIDSPYILADLQHESFDGFSRILFAANERVDFITYELQDPYRVVIDLIGVSFCELEEHVEYDKGVVKSIEIMPNPYARLPEALDEYFYAVDYVIITPASEEPYFVSLSENDRVLAIEIGRPKESRLAVSEEKPSSAWSEEEKIADQQGPKEQLKESEQVAEEPLADLAIVNPYAYLDEHIIDYMHCEVLDDSSLIAISTNKDIEFEVAKRYYPKSDIILRPQGPVFTDLEESISIENAYVKSLKIIKDETAPAPETLDEYFYAIKYIVVEPTSDFPFDFYTNEDGTLSILEMYYPKAVTVVQREVAPGAETVVKRKPEPEPEPKEIRLEPESRKELIRELKEDIKREGLLKEEKLAELKKEELIKRKQEAESAVEAIGKELLKDLFVRGKGLLSLKDAQTFAVDNNPKIETSRKEVQLSKHKKREAIRALFPNVKLKASRTDGDIFEEGEFTEEIYAVEAEHPLYQGKRLWNTYKQSKVNVKLAQSRYHKEMGGVDFKVAESYYDIVTAIMNIRLQKELLDEAARVLKLAEARHGKGLSTNLEILNVRSRHNQIQFQIATAQRDLALARFKLKQAMNIDDQNTEIDLAEVDTELQFKVIDVDLDQCLRLASENHPDILVNNFLVDSNKYGEKISKGKKSLKVDFTSSYGIADSYYSTESKDLEPEWSVGIKVSKPFWGHTPSYSFTKEKTSRKLGQTDKTGSTVNAGEIALFDKDVLGVKSEIRESKINRMKAENDLMEARKNIALEVKESYYSYQESIIQVKNSLIKVRFQEEAVKVARAQARLNEALQSQVLESMIQLADEKSVYIKALSDFNLALAKLNKAVGIKDYFSIN